MMLALANRFLSVTAKCVCVYFIVLLLFMCAFV